MARHRRPHSEDDTRIEGRLPDGDTILPPGHRQWSDLVARRPAPVVNPDPPAELVRPYVTGQDSTRWLQ